MTDHDLLKKKFGETVRNLRKQRGFSQEELAERAALHRNYVGSLERGERNVALINIVIIARALEVAPSHLLEGLS